MPLTILSVLSSIKIGDFPSVRPGIKFQPGSNFLAGPGSNFLVGAWGTASGRVMGWGFLVNIWSPVRLAEVIKLFKR